MNYSELYYTYLAQCDLDNWANMRDPNHDYMEWNHTLPQCIFGDQPFGQWLTIEQHAIVSALQTLAFGRKCTCGWHKHHMPALLWDLHTKFYPPICRAGGLATGKVAAERGIGIHTEDENLRRGWASLGGRKARGKVYWNNGKVNKRAVECPGPEWIRGILTTRWNERKKKVKFRCMVTGFVSTSSGLTTYQQRRNIDTSLREQIN